MLRASRSCDAHRRASDVAAGSLVQSLDLTHGGLLRIVPEVSSRCCGGILQFTANLVQKEPCFRMQEAHRASPQAAAASRPGLVLGVLSLGGGAYALLQSLVVPALPVLQHDLHTSTAGVAWIFTSYLLAAAVVTPIAGRLGDMFGKKRVLVIVLAGLAAGSLLAAVVTSLPLMIVARTIQGLGGAIFPLAFGILRDEFPRERVAGAIALVSGLLGIGGGLGIVLAGPILQHLSYHWLFWIPLVVTGGSAVAATVLIPESTLRAPGNVHWLGVVLLSGWLVGLLLAVSQSSRWGWGSGKTIGLIIVA